MTLYEKNLKTLASHYPEMDILIKDARKKMEPELGLMEEISADGERILRIEKDGKECYLGGKRNAREPAKMWVENIGKLLQNAPIFMMGVGNPMYLEELINHTDTRVAIVVYEPSLQIFLYFLETVDIEKWMEKHLIIFWVNGLEGMEEKQMKGVLRGLLTCEMIPYSRNIILPNYDVLFGKEAVDFVRICCDIAREEVSGYATALIFSPVMVKNLLSNARYLCDGYKTTQLIEVIPRDIPGILVAAGPSLNKNIEKLKRAKGKAFIIAVDTAIKPLMKAGIVPDMFALIDAVKPVDLVQIDGVRDIPLLTTLNAASEVLEYHTGMKFFFNEGYRIAEEIFARSGKKMGDVSCGGSVATTVFSLFYKIGITRIILVGQDLAYTNNKSHADGTFQEVMEEQDTSNFMMVEGNYEKQVPTAHDLKTFLTWYDMYIAGCKEHEKNFHVINATEGGAKINHTEIMSLEEAIERECTKSVDIGKCLERLEPMLDETGREWAVSYLKSVPAELRKLKENSKKVKGLYGKLDKICNKKNIDRKEYLGIIKKLENEIQKIEAQGAYQLVTVTMSNAKYILRTEQFMEEDTMQAEGKEIARKGLLYMKNVDACTEAFVEYADEVYTDFQ